MASQPADCELVYLPAEVLLRIARNLTTSELGKMRLTCKAIEKPLFLSFAHEFFRKKQFMFFEDSLQALVDISRDPSVAKYLVCCPCSASCLAAHVKF